MLSLPLLYIGLCPRNKLSNPANGTVMVTGLTEGSNAVYTCESDYQLSGEQIRTCLSNGTWRGEEPTCLRTMDVFILC